MASAGVVEEGLDPLAQRPLVHGEPAVGAPPRSSRQTFSVSSMASATARRSVFARTHATDGAPSSSHDSENAMASSS
jgi:hypothetical protein